METYLEGLNEKQLEAVLDTEGYVLVFAGAGSGKTAVLTTRIAHLVKAKGIRPENILAITFTNKAADEMKERLNGLIGDCGNMWVSTIHSMCVRILRNSIGRLQGYDKNFSIYSETDKNNVIKRIIAAMNLDSDKYLKNAKYLISDCKNKDLDAGDLKRRTDLRDASAYAQIYYAYEEELRRSNALDFDDLLVKTYHLLEDDAEVRSYYSDKFQYIHIDEFQDTNEIQLAIAKLLSAEHGNLFVVGDDDQSIYGWRGAEIHNILDFEHTFRGAKVYKLEQNYRSTKNILDLANTIIAGNSVRKQKRLWTENAEGEKVELKVADEAEGEASYVALKIKQLMASEGAKASDFAVLMRINALSRPFEQEFNKYNIPYKVFGGFKFFERKEIKDLTAYFRVITNPLDNESLLRIINVPKRSIGDKTVSVLEDYAKQYGLSIFDGMVDADKLELGSAAKQKLTEFRKLITKLTVNAQVMPLTEIFTEVVEKTQFLSQFEADTEENYGKKMNVNEYQNSIEEFAKLNPNATLPDFLNSITLSSDTDELEDGNFVSIATIHSVKGLEFPNVFVCGLDETIFPVSRAAEGKSEMEEERRLMYVAITRAQSRLFLTRAKSRFLYGSRQYLAQSCFLTELSDKLGIQQTPSFIRRSDSYGGGYQKSYGGYSSSGGYGGYNGFGYGKSSGSYENRDEYYPDESSDYSGSSYKTQNVSGSKNSGGGFMQSSAKAFIQSGTQKPSVDVKGKDFSQYVAGRKVSHVKFGVGTIINVTGEGKNIIANVAFPGVGVKSLSVAYAPMDVIKS